MRLLQYDVFTDRPFAGNQLAVFPEARGLLPAQMQTLAKEMNFSESTFVFPAETPGTDPSTGSGSPRAQSRGDIRMRIFTPGSELPMAGHPVIGTTFALADEGVIATGRDAFVFELNIGPTRVELAWDANGPSSAKATEGKLSFAWMDQKVPEFREALSRADVIRAAGVDPAAVEATQLPIEEGSSGNPFIFLPVATRAAVDAAEPDTSTMKRLQSAFPGRHIGIFVFSVEPVDREVTAYSRMFASGQGIEEDPATGSATGPLGAYLVRHKLAPATGDLISLQGVAMGRPSRLHMRITRTADGAITRVQVGGKAVRVAEGTLVAKP